MHASLPAATWQERFVLYATFEADCDIQLSSRTAACNGRPNRLLSATARRRPPPPPQRNTFERRRARRLVQQQPYVRTRIRVYRCESGAPNNGSTDWNNAAVRLQRQRQPATAAPAATLTLIKKFRCLPTRTWRNLILATPAGCGRCNIADLAPEGRRQHRV